ncbi:MAG: hypothetical protein ACI83B_000179 [Sediminicola sp.]
MKRWNYNLDFIDSCALNNGAFVSGVTRMVYWAIITSIRSVNKPFDSYTDDGYSAVGGGELLRKISNANGNAQYTVNMLITVSLIGSDVSVTRDGLCIAQWVQGYWIGRGIDNVYRVSGDWVPTFSSGFSRSGIVTDVLIRRPSCLFVESDDLVIERQGQTAKIDCWTDTRGNMDNLTSNGRVHPIIFGD